MTIHEINAATGEAIDREPTAAELAQKKVDEQDAVNKADAQAQRAADKAALLERLGITADEAALLLG
jgi:hypothetical protein